MEKLSGVCETMKIYSYGNFESQGLHSLGSSIFALPRCPQCSRILQKGDFPDCIELPYVALYSGEDFFSIDVSISSISGFVLFSEKALDVLKRKFNSIATLPAILRKVGKGGKVVAERGMSAIIPVDTHSLDPVVFQMNRIIDCLGCGGISWSWSGNQGVYPFRGERKCFHLFRIDGDEMTTYLSEDLIAFLSENDCTGIPPLRQCSPFGEWAES